MKIHTCKQGGEEWERLRLGIPTASEFHRILSPTGKPSTQATAYMHRLLAEWMVDCPLEDTETRWMERGQDLEPQAVKCYEFETERKTAKVGFITTDTGLIGASPDRLVGDDGLLEIKCPAPQTHVGYMLTNQVDQAYWPQLQGQLWISERAWVDIESYCPGFPTVVIRVERNEEYISQLSEALETFIRRMLIARQDLERKFGPFQRLQVQC